MMNSRKLWYERFQAFLNVFVRYMRLIANSGLLFSFIFSLIFGSYYYSLLIKQIPEPFPVLVLIAVIMTFVLTKTNIRTFLKRADLVYLLPAEERMKGFFTSALCYNIILQMVVTFLISIILAPLYAVRMDDSSYPYTMIILIFMLIKVWNVFVHWHALKLNSDRAIMRDTVLRVFATLLLVYLVLIGADIRYIVIVGGIMIVFLFYVSKTIAQEHRIKWERLLEREEELATRFYKFVNAFVDVPALTQRVKTRRWTQLFTLFLRHEPSSVPYVLYINAFFRSGQYFGIYIRLLVIGLLVLAFLPYEYGKLLGMVLFLYMTAVQLSPLVRHFSDRDVLTLYPIAQYTYVQAFQNVILSLLIIESLLFAVIIFITGVSFVHAVLLFFATVFMIYLYVKQSIKKEMGTE